MNLPKVDGVGETKVIAVVSWCIIETSLMVNRAEGVLEA
jgi:hypothetical protein